MKRDFYCYSTEPETCERQLSLGSSVKS